MPGPHQQGDKPSESPSASRLPQSPVHDDKDKAEKDRVAEHQKSVEQQHGTPGQQLQKKDEAEQHAEKKDEAEVPPPRA